MTLLLTIFGLALLSVPLAGGDLRRLAELRFSWTSALFTALGLQFVLFQVLPEGGSPVVYGAAHLWTYVLAGAFLLKNRRIPGLWLFGVGYLTNVAALGANGGTMPASPAAVAAAGLAERGDRFVNSGVLDNPRLSFLGDIWAVPAPLPFANVFSVGDVCLWLGAAILLHRVCGSRLVPSGDGQFRALLEHRGLLRLWSAYGISNLGDWTYSLAVTASAAAAGGGGRTLVAILVSQVGPATLTSLFGGPLVDRWPRRRIMVIADVCRGLAVMTLLLDPRDPSLVHLCVVAAVIGICAALFQPAMHASLPNLVPAERLVAANALVSGTQHLAIMAGPILGGLLVAQFGVRPAYILNAATFGVSALLVARLRLPDRRDEIASAGATKLLVEGLRHSLTTPLVRGVLVVLGVTVLAAALRSPLEAVFVVQALEGDTAALGLVGGAWGFGMLLASVAAPALARRWSRERLVAVGIGAVGLAVVGASRSHVLSPVLGFWIVAGAGNAVGTIAYETLLQERTPDALRGRVMAGVDTIVQGAYLLGALIAGWLSLRTDIRTIYLVSGLGFLSAAGLAIALLRPPRPVAAAPGARPVQPASKPVVAVLTTDVDLVRRVAAALDGADVAVQRAATVAELRVMAAVLRVRATVVDVQTAPPDAADGPVLAVVADDGPFGIPVPAGATDVVLASAGETELRARILGLLVRQPSPVPALAS